MKVYSYSDDKIYIEPCNAQPSPAEPGKFLIPRNATTVKPPDLKNDQLAYWNGSKWEIQNKPQPPPEPVHEPAPEPITWDTIRFERNGYLYQTDWTDLPNTPLTNKQAWLTYRQALRDVTKNFTKPEDVVWPQKPN
jgi:hypothetical protein